MAMIILLIVSVINTSQVVDLIREDQKANNERTKQIEEIAQTIEDCTSKKGECYIESEARVQEALKTRNEYLEDLASMAAICARDYSLVTVQQMRVCIDTMQKEGQ